MPYGHRVGTNKIPTNPPVATVYVEFFFCSVVCVILVLQFVLVADHFFSATHFDHGLSESCITDETIVNAQEISLPAFLLERIPDEVLVIPFFVPVAVPVGSPFPDVVVGNRKEVKN